MLFFEYLMLALVVGTVGGVGWRLVEDYFERRDNRSIEEASSTQEPKQP